MMAFVPFKAAERREAAEVLRRVLDAVADGTLAADGPAAVAVVHRLEGALIALDVDNPLRELPKPGDSKG